MTGLTFMDENIEDLSDEIDALLMVWNVDSKEIELDILRDVIKRVMLSVYSCTLIASRLRETLSSLSGQELENTLIASSLAEVEIKNLFDITQKLVPHVPRNEFILGFIQIIHGIDTYIKLEDE
ncbi:MAG: hypothetical protein ACXADD_16240 [Candidatus Thorarchaeota archaeon]|jgi:hypothetical protein